MTLKISNISDFIPHRYENILLDTIYKEADTNLEGSLELKITENKSLYDSTAIILDNYKKSKDEIFLNCLDFLIEIKFNNVSKFENKDFLKFLNTKSSLIKLLYDFKNFNLNSTSVLDYIRRHVYYA